MEANRQAKLLQSTRTKNNNDLFRMHSISLRENFVQRNKGMKVEYLCYRSFEYNT